MDEFGVDNRRVEQESTGVGQELMTSHGKQLDSLHGQAREPSTTHQRQLLANVNNFTSSERKFCHCTADGMRWDG